jgi:potassium/hydrogen antiporter
MTDQQAFALVVLLGAATVLVAVLSSRLARRTRVPAPALFLAGAALVANVFPSLHVPSELTVQRVVTLALTCILFDGGMSIGWRRLRSEVAPIAMTGVVGTILTLGGVALFAHLGLGLSWYLAVLLGTAVAATDPAVVFSVLSQQRIAGRPETVLEGESGANDPVGIALMTSLLAAGSLHAGAVGHAALTFVIQMAVGLGIGLLGGYALGWFMRRVPLPSEELYPLRTLASAIALFALATLAHGSGFLAVFVAGIVIGDERAPYKWEIERFHSALAGLGEVVVFVLLGLTVDTSVLARSDVWVPGVALGAVLAFAIRPLVVGACLLTSRLEGNERLFVMLAGLKGAVPILLGGLLLTSHVVQAQRLYGIIVIVVMFSVVVQCAAIPSLGRLLRLPMHPVELEPWSLGLRLRDEPNGVHRFTVARGSIVEGRRIADLGPTLGAAWISLVVREDAVVAVRGDLRLEAGDALLVLADAHEVDALETIFG